MKNEGVLHDDGKSLVKSTLTYQRGILIGNIPNEIKDYSGRREYYVFVFTLNGFRLCRVRKMSFVMRSKG